MQALLVLSILMQSVRFYVVFKLRKNRFTIFRCYRQTALKVAAIGTGFVVTVVLLYLSAD